MTEKIIKLTKEDLKELLNHFISSNELEYKDPKILDYLKGFMDKIVIDNEKNNLILKDKLKSYGLNHNSFYLNYIIDHKWSLVSAKNPALRLTGVSYLDRNNEINWQSIDIYKKGEL